MYKVHQDSKLLHFELESENYQFEDQEIPALNASASINEEGQVNITICNLNADQEIELNSNLFAEKFDYSKVEARVLTADKLNAHNSFYNPENIKPAELKSVKLADNKLNITLPAASATLVTLS
jgi:alpha-N-arabinofuranosidase